MLFSVAILFDYDVIVSCCIVELWYYCQLLCCWTTVLLSVAILLDNDVIFSY